MTDYLIETTIIFPNLSASWESFLTNKYGGFTRTQSSGAWQDFHGRVESEQVYVYTVAIPIESISQLRTVAQLEAIAQNQDALYFAIGRIAEVVPTQRIVNPENLIEIGGEL